jgi:hypothetical protein
METLCFTHQLRVDFLIAPASLNSAPLHVGHPALAQHLHAVTALMKGSRNWDEFKRMIDKVFPRRGENLELEFVEEADVRCPPK